MLATSSTEGAAVSDDEPPSRLVPVWVTPEAEEDLAAISVSLSLRFGREIDAGFAATWLANEHLRTGREKRWFRGRHRDRH